MHYWRGRVVMSPTYVRTKIEVENRSIEHLSSFLFSAMYLICLGSFEAMGVSMVLVGETLMRAENPGKAIRALLGEEEPAPVRKRQSGKM